MEDRTCPRLGVIIPCYNEELILTNTLDSVSAVLQEMTTKGKISRDSFILVVDDGSSDSTWGILSKHPGIGSKHIRGIRLSHNAGHQNALLAGLLETKGGTDCAISIDADLQDDIRVLEKFVAAYRDGYDIVYGVRRKRDSDSFFKRTSALLFYRLMRLMGIDIVYNHADYRLTSRKVIENLALFQESNLFLRGIFPTMGFRSIEIPYDRKKRTAGTSKYPLGRMVSLALDGITSFSEKPLRLVTVIGVIVFFLSTLLVLYTLYASLIAHETVPGWASTVLPIYFLGGLQILCIGIIGEYIGRIYRETKRRPRYIVAEKTIDQNDESKNL